MMQDSVPVAVSGAAIGAASHGFAKTLLHPIDYAKLRLRTSSMEYWTDVR